MASKTSSPRNETSVRDEQEIRNRSLGRLYQMNDKVFGLIFMAIFVSPLLCVAFIGMGTNHNAAAVPILIVCMIVLIGISVVVAKYCLRPRALDDFSRIGGKEKKATADGLEEVGGTSRGAQDLTEEMTPLRDQVEKGNGTPNCEDESGPGVTNDNNDVKIHRPDVSLRSVVAIPSNAYEVEKRKGAREVLSRVATGSSAEHGKPAFDQEKVSCEFGSSETDHLICSVGNESSVHLTNITWTDTNE
ncbi:uncharacterized protein [Ptychodera flava]|uniref:uncharacterized protein n=1 Tax=Ptychodera flava TaxID=63121 RepID=UPI00396A418E